MGETKHTPRPMFAEYEKATAFAAGFAKQQMIDRDAGLLGCAAFCQEKAAEWGRRAMAARAAIAKAEGRSNA